MAANRQLKNAAISQSLREKTATFSQPGRKEGETERFPMPDVKHARLALQMLPGAKDMPRGAATQVRNRAHRMLGH